MKELEDAILAAGQEVEKDDTTEARLQELLDALLAVELVTKLDEKKAELDAAVKASLPGEVPGLCAADFAEQLGSVVF